MTYDPTVCTNSTYCFEVFITPDTCKGVCVSHINDDRLPGAKCTLDSEYYEMSCVDNVCKGRASGEQCDVGHYCDYNDGVVNHFREQEKSYLTSNTIKKSHRDEDRN